MITINNSTITILVRDLDKSIAFYESIGLTTAMRWGNHYAELTAPGIVIGLHPANSLNIPNHSGNVSIGFTTNDISLTKSILENSSITTTERNEEGGQFLHFNDLDGTSIYFIHPKH